MSRLALSIDLERCTGCKSCEAACKQANGLGPHSYRNRVMWLGGIDAPQLDFLDVTCQQCERPACLRACPVNPKAITKEPVTGVVSVNADSCTGCGECVVACPYGAMGFEPRAQHAVKCDLCAPRRVQGEGPACAEVCPTRAIRFGTRDEHVAHAADTGRTVRDQDHFMLGPATLYLERRAKAKASDFSVPAVMADSEPRRPLDKAELTAPYAQAAGSSAAGRDTASANAEHQALSAAPAATGPDRRIDATATPGAASTPGATVVPGGCHICFNACTVNYSVQGNRIVNVFGNASDPVFEGRVCPKSQMTLQLYEHPDRLKYPLRRTRGGRLERVSWDAALDEIVERLTEVREAHGSEALALQAGTRTGVLNIMGFMRMFGRLWGTQNIATTEPFCDAGKVVALELTLGSTNLPNVYTPDDIGSAELYVYIGDNAAETRPVNFGLVVDWRQRSGARMVVVDPRMSATAAKADAWLAIRPGTDMALGLALIHHVLARGLHDARFCHDYMLGFEAWRGFVLDANYSPDWAAGITGLDASSIEALGDEIAAADGCMLFTSRGVNQHTNSTQTNRVFMFLAAITGNFGRRGGGYFNVAAEPDWKPIPLPEACLPSNVRPAVSKNPAAWLDAMLGEGPYRLSAMITGNNPAAQWPGQTRVREALQGLDLLVHVDLFENETSQFADFVLPAATGLEKGGISRLAEDRRIVWNERLLEPPGDARSDHWIWIELGKRFGYDEVLEDRYKDPGIFWDEVFRHATPDLTGASLARLRSTPHRWLRTPIASEDAPEPSTLYLEGTTAFGCDDDRRFPTPSGRLEFFSTELDAKFSEVGLSALPQFYSEAEQLVDLPHFEPDATRALAPSPFFGRGAYVRPGRIVTRNGDGRASLLRAAGYDTELVTGRPCAPHFHSWTHYFWQAQEMWPELFCQLHPDKARGLGVADGDRVRVETPTASVDARAWVTQGIRPSAVFVPIGWGETQPFNPAKPVNFLVGRDLDPVSQQMNLKVQLCRVTRLVGA